MAGRLTLLERWRRLPGGLQDAAVLAGLAGLVVIAFLPAATGHASFFASDIEHLNLPFRSHFARWWSRGIFAWWCPLVDCGFPLFAEGEAGALYPGTWLFGLIRPLWWALTVNLLGHVWWGGVGVYFWTRSLGACRLGSAVAAMTFALSGAMVERMVQINTQTALAWMPFAAWGYEVGLRGRWRGHLAAGGAVALQALAGHPHVVLLTLLLLAGRATWATRRPRWWSPWLALAAVGVVGFSGGAGQLLATAELVPHSVRAGGLSWAVVNEWRMKLEHLPLLFATTARGLPSQHGTTLPDLPWEWQCSLGRVPLLLLAAAPVVTAKARPWAALAWAALVLAFGNLLYRLVWMLPVWHQQRGPARLNLVFTVAGCAAIALTVTRLRADAARRGILSAAAGVLLVIAAAAALARPTAAGGQAHPSVWGEPAEWLTPLLLFGLGLAVLLRPLPERLFVPILLVLVATDLLVATAGLQPLAEPAYWDSHDPRTAVIARAGVRVHASFTLSPELGSPHNLRFGVANTSIVSPLALGRTRRLLERLEAVSVEQAAAGPLPPQSSGGRVMSMLRVGYAPRVMLDGSAPGSGKAIVPVPFAPWPRALVVPTWEAGPSEAFALDCVCGALDLREQAVVETAQSGAGSGRVSSVSDHGPNRLSLELEATGRPLLVLPESAFPGWRAWIDERPASWCVADSFARGLPLPAGRHLVRWVYDPFSVRVGLFLTLCMIGLLAAQVGRVRRTRRGPLRRRCRQRRTPRRGVPTGTGEELRRPARSEV